MSMSEQEQEDRLAVLSAETQNKRLQVKALATLARERTRPARLAEAAGNRVADAVLDIKDAGVRWARSNPFKAVGIGGVVGAIVARKPLWKLVSKLAGTIKGRKPGKKTRDKQADGVPPEGD